MVAQNCQHCNKEFQTRQAEINRGYGKFCSLKCSGAYKSKTTRPREHNAACALCGIKIYVRPSVRRKSKSGLFFCSRDHQGRGFALGIVKSGPPSTAGRVRSKCPDCGVNYSGNLGACKKCSRDRTIEQWLAGDNSVTLNGGRTRETKKFVKQYLIETRGDRCEVCGFDEKAPDGRSIIQMDHIDGNCFNNAPSNLQLLCPNHHAMTPTYGSLNTGSGRAHRRKQTS